MHGPGPRTNTNPLGWEPVYPDPIIVLDDVMATLPERRWSWRRARTRALRKWEQAGLRFSVTEGNGFEYEAEEPWKVGGILGPYIVDGTIRLLRYGVPGKPSFGYYSDIYSSSTGGKIGSGAIAVYAPEIITGEWLRRYKRAELAAHIAHEIGHCLGLWHRDRAIMGGGWNPDEHDLQSLEAHYGD